VSAPIAPRTPLAITGACPACRRTVEWKVAAGGAPILCPACGAETLLTLGDSFFERGALDRCAVCAERHLYRQKDFNQTTGCVIMAIGAITGLILAGLYGALWLWAVLLLTAALDAVLYRLVPEVVICYRCKAHFRGFADLRAVPPFDLQLADAIEGRMGGGMTMPPESPPRR